MFLNSRTKSTNGSGTSWKVWYHPNTERPCSDCVLIRNNFITKIISLFEDNIAITKQILNKLKIKIQGVYKWMVQFQKLTRNLFLTLHEQNVHRQQRKLSKFRMRYQQFAFHAYCGAAGSVYKGAPQQEKAFCVLRFEVSRSVITVQRQFRASFLNRAWKANCW